MRTAAFQPSIADGDLVSQRHRLYPAIKAGQADYCVLDACERLVKMPEYAALTDAQKSIIFAHVKNPELNKDQLAIRLKMPRADIYATFQSDVFRELTKELADQEVTELTLLAVKTLRKLLLTGPNHLKFSSAIAVLQNTKIFTGNVQTIKTDNKFLVVWGSQSPGVEQKAMSLTLEDGNKNPICSASQTSGSP